MLTIFKMQWYYALYIHVPVSHNVPVQPVSQLHWNDPAKLLHEPWTHGDWRHSLMSENSKCKQKHLLKETCGYFFLQRAIISLF